VQLERDNTKEERNRKKHRIDFRTAAKVFRDPFVVDFEDRDPSGEMRFNTIGFVEGRARCHLHDPRRRDPYHFGERRRAP
jgi:uncharacterized DUF497 family protein